MYRSASFLSSCFMVFFTSRIIIVLNKLINLLFNLLVILMSFLLSVQDAAVILEQCCPVQTSPCGWL